MEWEAVLLGTFTLGEILARLGAAALFGMVIGFDRELRDKPAGLRTHMLVALGAATATLAAFEIYFSVEGTSDSARLDPIRVIEGVIGGIGFLGAGAIIRRPADTVEGITTAANIWLSGGIGIACGGGYYALAGVAVAFAIVILTALRWFERLINPGGRH